jgi:hypothetical protein
MTGRGYNGYVRLIQKEGKCYRRWVKGWWVRLIKER